MIRCDFAAETLKLDTSMTVILPEDRSADRPPPVLYLLHGLTDDHTAWTRWTSIERYATAKGLAVVMPQVHRSFYADEAYGMRFWEFMSEELPEVVGQFFRVSSGRADTFVAGLSMGGYGAMKTEDRLVEQNERFVAACAAAGVELDAAFSPGEHEWSFWDTQIQTVIDWLPVKIA